MMSKSDEAFSLLLNTWSFCYMPMLSQLQRSMVGWSGTCSMATLMVKLNIYKKWDIVALLPQSLKKKKKTKKPRIILTTSFGATNRSQSKLGFKMSTKNWMKASPCKTKNYIHASPQFCFCFNTLYFSMAFFSNFQNDDKPLTCLLFLSA